MAYARVTSVTFPELNTAEGARVLAELNEADGSHEGHLLGMVLRSTVDHNQYESLSLWQDRDKADHASRNDRVVALHSRLNTLTVDGHHREESFEYVGDIKKLRLTL